MRADCPPSETHRDVLTEAVSISSSLPVVCRGRWEGAFLRLSRPRLLVPPILQILVLSKRKQAVQEWVQRVSGWGFTQIIPAHLEAPIRAGPREFRDAFGFLAKKKDGAAGAAAGAAPRGGLQFPLPLLALPALAPANEARQVDCRPLLLCSRRSHVGFSPCPPFAAGAQVSPFGDKDANLLRTINNFLLSTGTITED